LRQLLSFWPWTPRQRQHIIVRADAEMGTDANLSYLLWQGFPLLMKGYSGRRTESWVAQLDPDAWQGDPDRSDRSAACAPVSLRLGRHLTSYVLSWPNQKQEWQYATLHSTLPYPVFVLWNLYDGRGSMEVEIRADKSGLSLPQRRKHSLAAQEGWIVLTDVAHNLLAWLTPWMFVGSAFEGFGPKRVVKDLFWIPGQLTFKGDQLRKVALRETHPYAAEMQLCLRKLLKTFDLA
jgi:hypothetical protein